MVNLAETCLEHLHPRINAELRLLKARRTGNQMLSIIDGLVRPGDTAVDIGARRGVLTLRMARLVGPRGHVHAIEPFPANVAAIRRLRRTNVTVHPVAVAEHAGHHMLHVPAPKGKPLDALASLTPPVVSHQTIDIEVRPLDDVLNPERNLSFVKCDAEGHELHVLRGADRLLRRHEPPLAVRIEQRHQRESIDRTFAHITGLGYSGFFFGPEGAHPLDQFDVERHQLRFLTGEFFPGSMPRGYVNCFLFMRDAARAGPLVAC